MMQRAGTEEPGILCKIIRFEDRMPESLACFEPRRRVDGGQALVGNLFVERLIITAVRLILTQLSPDVGTAGSPPCVNEKGVRAIHTNSMLPSSKRAS